MVLRILRKALVLLFLCALTPSVLATHMRALEIQIKRLNCSTLTVEIIVTAYLNTQGSSVTLGGEESILNLGDGSTQSIPPSESVIIDAEFHIARAQYKLIYTYSTFGTYKISVTEPNRNAGILNIPGSINLPVYAESAILLEPGVCNLSPEMLLQPVDRACTGVAFYHNPGAQDPDGDSLSYELLIPRSASGTDVANYLPPNHHTFYADYERGNENKNGRPSYAIDPVTGTITWDAPAGTGEYGIAMKIREWKYNPQLRDWYEVGYVIRDMQIIVAECLNQRPGINVPSEICVTAGETLQLDIPVTDPDNHDVVVEAVSEIFKLGPQPAQVSPANGTVQSTNPPFDTASVRVTWQTSCEAVRARRYGIVLKISDRPPLGVRLVRFYTVNVQVVAPAPEYEQVSINPVTKRVTLNWKDYGCENVQSFQIWRRVSEYQYDQSDCETGMPNFLRYQLLDEVPASSDQYTDTDLSFGSQYCYRIVPLIGQAKIPGRMSIDTCFIPKPAEAPIVVNVSVETTDPREGSMLVRWTSPFDIDPLQYPAPYLYHVLRKNESDPGDYSLATAVAVSDTVFVDTGLNTLANTYRYQIVLYVPSLTSSPLDTSSAASSAFVTSEGITDGINLQWRANTPWYNYSQSHPYHLIYRSEFPNGPFELIDSVHVNLFDFNYSDRGQYKDLGLDGGVYFYRIRTRGSYGNPAIISPIENLSQITAGQVLDTIPPCAPHASVVATDCSEFACDGSDYYTTLRWDTDCDEEPISYEILVKDEGAESYTLLTTLKENSFVHRNITSLNKCYIVLSVDQSGNRSDSSVAICNSNCVRFKLPNIITPGLSDDRNDYLATYPSDDDHRGDCSRSIKSVDLTIFSRWGDEIFTTTLDNESVVFWDGRNALGEEVSSGTYFYQASVVFDTRDVTQRTQKVKGWVQVMR